MDFDLFLCNVTIKTIKTYGNVAVSPPKAYSNSKACTIDCAGGGCEIQRKTTFQIITDIEIR